MTTTTLQPCDADAKINSGAPTTNYGTNNDQYALSSGESNISSDVIRTLIKFNGMSDGTIPSANTIVSAKLGLTLSFDISSNTRTTRIYRTKRAWVETQVTWNIYSTGNNWATAGGFGTADCEQTDIGSLSLSDTESVNTLKEWTLTASSVQDFITGSWTNNGLFIKTDTEANDCWCYYSRENATSSYRPKMTIEHVAGGQKTTWFFCAVRQWVWERWGEMGLEWLRRQAYPIHYTLDRRTGLWVNPITEARYMKPDAIMYRTILRAGSTA